MGASACGSTAAGRGSHRPMRHREARVVSGGDSGSATSRRMADLVATLALAQYNAFGQPLESIFIYDDAE